MDSRKMAGGGEFRTTHWSLVLEAGVSSEGGRKALEALCHTYWIPLYAFVRRRGFDATAAEDLTQEFFARLLQSGGFSAASRERGRFRSFLLAALKNFLANEWDKSQRLKRGRGVELLHLDALEAESRFHLEPADAQNQETLFDREWAEALVDGVLARLRTEAERESGVERFDVLKVFLVTDAPASYAEISAQLGLSEAAVKSAIHRLRRRYAELLRAAVAQTVDSPAEVDNELRHLFATLMASPS